MFQPGEEVVISLDGKEWMTRVREVKPLNLAVPMVWLEGLRGGVMAWSLRYPKAGECVPAYQRKVINDRLKELNGISWELLRVQLLSKELLNEGQSDLITYARLKLGDVCKGLEHRLKELDNGQ